mmetsp:Transcript_26822/g.79025  ORF Transcript_26822/g.79025 Transcript_26822/m.79025 type:complete len:219 (+) Transcript_26822:1-657(+)
MTCSICQYSSRAALISSSSAGSRGSSASGALWSSASGCSSRPLAARLCATSSSWKCAELANHKIRAARIQARRAASRGVRPCGLPGGTRGCLKVYTPIVAQERPNQTCSTDHAIPISRRMIWSSGPLAAPRHKHALAHGSPGSPGHSTRNAWIGARRAGAGRPARTCADLSQSSAHSRSSWLASMRAMRGAPRTRTMTSSCASSTPPASRVSRASTAR